MTAVVIGLHMKVQNQEKSGDKYIGVKGTVPILKKVPWRVLFVILGKCTWKTWTNFSGKLYCEMCYIDYRVSQ